MEKNSSMKYEVKAVGVWAFIKLAFFLNLVVGFIAGLIYAVMIIAMISVYSNIPFMNVPGIDPSDFAPGLFLIVFPLTFSLFGGPLLTIFETLVIILYNLFSRFLGGLELTLKPVSSNNIQTEKISSAPAVTSSIRPLPPVSPTPQPPQPPQVNQILNESISSSPAPSDSPAPDKFDKDAGHKDDNMPPPPPPPQQS